MDGGSIQHDVLRGVSRMLTSGALNDWNDTNVKVRRRPAFVRERDPLPVLVVAPGPVRVDEHQFGNTLFLLYTVTVAAFAEGALVLEGAGLQDWLRRLHGLRLALHKTAVTAAAEVFDVADFDPDVPFDPGAFDRELDVSALRVTYRSSEARSS